VTCCGRQLPAFEYFIGLIILTNVISIGVEEGCSLHNINNPDDEQYEIKPFELLEYAFLGIYCAEIGLRLLAHGLKALRSNMMPFDVMLVMLGLVTVALSSDFLDVLDGHTSKGLEMALLFRVLRLFRLLRALRMVKYFRTLWRLVSGLVNSFPAMTSTIAVFVFANYVASCFAIELVAKDSLLRSIPETRDIIDTYFSSLPVVMLSFTQFVTLDSVSAIYFPLVKNRWYLFIYFGFLIVVISLGLMNLVTACLVQAAISNTKRDTEMEKQKVRKLRPEFKAMFEKLDIDNRNALRREEMLNTNIVWPPAILKIVPRDRLPDLFDVLDMDNSNSVSMEEFVEGMQQLAVSQKSFKSVQQLRLLSQIKSRQEVIDMELKWLHQRLKKSWCRQSSSPISWSEETPADASSKRISIHKYLSI